MAGLLNKVKNRSTGRRFLVSTIKKDDHTYETAVFPANFFYLPRGFKLTNPSMVKQCQDSEEADRIHRTLAERLQTEFPERLFKEFSDL